MPDDYVRPPMRIAEPAPTKGPLIEQPGSRTALGLGFAMAQVTPVRGPLIEGRPGEPHPKSPTPVLSPGDDEDEVASEPEPEPEDDDEDDANGVPKDDEDEEDEDKQPAPVHSARPRSAAELVAAAQGATSVEELDGIEAEAQGRSSVLAAVRDRRAQV